MVREVSAAGCPGKLSVLDTTEGEGDEDLDGAAVLLFDSGDLGLPTASSSKMVERRAVELELESGVVEEDAVSVLSQAIG